jgi:hypothetical protein
MGLGYLTRPVSTWNKGGRWDGQYNKEGNRRRKPEYTYKH